MSDFFENVQPQDKKKKERPKLSIQTTAELKEKDLPPMEWVVEDILPKGLTVLAGDAKVGKSFLCLNLMLAVSQGGVAFSAFNVPEPKTCMYMALEDAERSIKKRLNMMQPNESLPNNALLVLDMPYSLGKPGLEYLKEEIEENEIEMLIVDTFYHVEPITAQKGSSYDVDYAKLAPIHKFTHDNNLSIVLVTHTRKSKDDDNQFNQMQGSMARQGACDTLWMMRKKDDGHYLTVKGREMPEGEYPIDFQQGIWVATSQNERLRENVGDTRKLILDWLEQADGNGLKYGEIIQKCQDVGIGENTAKSHLRNMKNDNQIVQPKPRGEYYLSLDVIGNVKL